MIDWLGPIVREYYGGTEIGACVACDTDEWLAHPGTVGRPVADAAVRVLDAAGGQVPAGVSGHVYVKPPSCQPPFTYNGLEDASAAVVADGFVSIGDIGHVDDDGYLFITDRASDMVISGGVNIYPVEIEHCLGEIPEIHDSAVFGVPDPEFGEALVAHVQLRPGAQLTAEHVRDHVRRKLAGYKVPKTIVFNPDLPRDDSGKLVKRRLRDRHLGSNGQ
jgi:long-chain acyl-CoA synthetase